MAWPLEAAGSEHRLAARWGFPAAGSPDALVDNPSHRASLTRAFRQTIVQTLLTHAAGVDRTSLKGGEMPRYMVERVFPQGLEIPVSSEGATACLTVVDHNSEEGVTWLQSFVTQDHKKTYCVYPSVDAIRRSAERNGLPVTAIVPVRVL